MELFAAQPCDSQIRFEFAMRRSCIIVVDYHLAVVDYAVVDSAVVDYASSAHAIHPLFRDVNKHHKMGNCQKPQL